MDVDIRKCAFPSAPTTVTTAIVGSTGDLFATTGVSSVLTLSASTFRIIVFEEQWACTHTEIISGHWNLTWAAYSTNFCSKSESCCTGRLDYTNWNLDSADCTTNMPITPSSCDLTNYNFLFPSLMSNSSSATLATGIQVLAPPDSVHPSAVANVNVVYAPWICNSDSSLSSTVQVKDRWSVSYLFAKNTSPHCIGVASHWVPLLDNDYQQCSMKMHIDISSCKYQSSNLHINTRLRCSNTEASDLILGADVIYNVSPSGFDIISSYSPWDCAMTGASIVAGCDVIWLAVEVSDEEITEVSYVAEPPNEDDSGIDLIAVILIVVCLSAACFLVILFIILIVYFLRKRRHKDDQEIYLHLLGEKTKITIK